MYEYAVNLQGIKYFYWSTWLLIVCVHHLSFILTEGTFLMHVSEITYWVELIWFYAGKILEVGKQKFFDAEVKSINFRFSVRTNKKYQELLLYKVEPFLFLLYSA